MSTTVAAPSTALSLGAADIAVVVIYFIIVMVVGIWVRNDSTLSHVCFFGLQTPSIACILLEIIHISLHVLFVCVLNEKMSILLEVHSWFGFKSRQ